MMRWIKWLFLAMLISVVCAFNCNRNESVQIQTGSRVMVLDKTNFEEFLNSNGVVLVDFYTTWCGPCRAMVPVMEKLSQKYKVGKVDVEQEAELGAKYNVSSVPKFVFFKNGQEVASFTGARPESAFEEVFEKLK